MQELRIVAVSEDGSYAVLAVPGRGGRFSLPIDDRLRIVARGQFSRLAQYEIEVESPLRPKEIQDRIRAGETAEEIADAAGVPIERVRRFEGPVLAERAYRAQEAQRATIRHPGNSGPGPRLGDIVAERLTAYGASAEEAQWDSRKRADNSWQVQLMFTTDGRPHMAEWVFDPPRRHVTPADDAAARLCLPESELGALAPVPQPDGGATVTPIGSRLAPAVSQATERRAEPTGSGAGPGHPPGPRAGAHRAATGPVASPGQPPARPAVPAPASPGPAAAEYDAAGPGPARPGTAQHAAAQHAAAQHAAGQDAAGARSAAAKVGAAQAGAAQHEASQLEADQHGRTGQPGAGQHKLGSPAAAATPPGDPRPAATAEDDMAGSESMEEPVPPQRARAARKAAGGRSRRSSVPSWDEIMFGTSRQPE